MVEILRIEHICKTKNNREILHDCNLSLAKGSILCLMGLNNSKMGDLIDVLKGITHFDSGKIRVDDQLIEFSTMSEMYEAGIFCIGRQMQLLPNMSIGENVSLSSKERKNKILYHKKKVYTNATKFLEFVEADFSAMEMPGNLSKSQIHLAELAKALYENANVIIFNSTIEDYVSSEINNLIRIFRKICSMDKSIIITSNKFNKLVEESDRIAIMWRGRITKVFEKGEYNFGKISSTLLFNESINKKGSSLLPLNNLKDKSQVNNIGSGKYFRKNEIVIKNLYLSPLLRKVEIKIYPGEIIGLIDIQGGMTQKILSAIISPPQNHPVVFISNGKENKIQCYSDVLDNRIVYLNDGNLFENMPLCDNLCILQMKRMSNRFGVIKSRLYKHMMNDFKNAFSEYPITKVPHGYLDEINLTDDIKINMYKHTFFSPNLLLIENPTLNYDIVDVQRIYGMLHQVAARGTAVILIQSDISHAISICNRIILINENEITEPISNKTKATRIALNMIGGKKI